MYLSACLALSQLHHENNDKCIFATPSPYLFMLNPNPKCHTASGPSSIAHCIAHTPCIFLPLHVHAKAAYLQPVNYNKDPAHRTTILLRSSKTQVCGTISMNWRCKSANSAHLDCFFWRITPAMQRQQARQQIPYGIGQMVFQWQDWSVDQ